jgi:hypothetical protein
MKKYIEVAVALLFLFLYPTIVELLNVSAENNRLLFMGIVTVAAIFYLPKESTKAEVISK